MSFFPRQSAPLMLLTCWLSLLLSASQAAPPVRQISRTDLENKIRGGWAGKMIGVSYGAPTEFRYKGKINEQPLNWKPENVSNAIGQDDLYVGMTMSETMDRLGLEATTEQYGEAFKGSKYGLWHANAAARRLLNLGIKAPWSGHPKYNAHANDIDFQIEADFIGMMSPGLPRLAAHYSERVGHVMNYGDGLYGGIFLNGMYSAAFFEPDPRKVVEQGVACLPPSSLYARLISDVLAWQKQYPQDWKKCWQLVEDKYDKDDSCPEGSLDPFNIDASINGAYIVLGLLYGGKDFGPTMEIATRAGQDSDCNPSTAAGVLGVMVGYNAIPDQWKSGIPALADQKFQFTNSSYNDISRATLDRALKLVEKAGGKVQGDQISIPVQTPTPVKFEQWSMGKPTKRLSFKDADWKWLGNWSNLMQEQWDHKGEFTLVGKMTEGAGSEVSLAFEGTAIAILGVLDQTGGRADIYLDGKKAEWAADAYIVPDTNDPVLWHTYGVKPGQHALRIVPRNDADSRSKGKKIAITGAVIYDATLMGK
jgi:hypothetical protein